MNQDQGAVRSAGHGTGMRVCVPVYNDWACAVGLLQGLDEVAAELRQPVDVLLVEDGSSEQVPPWIELPLRHLSRVEVLHLRRNIGHQRAIALGLAYLHSTASQGLTVVMDGEGEDDPRSLPALLARSEQLGHTRVVFASRGTRTEGWIFRTGYWLFRLLHLLLIGRSVRVGNFSLIPPRLLPRVVGVSEIWNHYAAGVHHARLPVDSIPIDRGHRLAGTSKMNFVSLVTHGMPAVVFASLLLSLWTAGRTVPGRGLKCGDLLSFWGAVTATCGGLAGLTLLNGTTLRGLLDGMVLQHRAFGSTFIGPFPQSPAVSPTMILMTVWAVAAA